MPISPERTAELRAEAERLGIRQPAVPPERAAELRAEAERLGIRRPARAAPPVPAEAAAPVVQPAPTVARPVPIRDIAAPIPKAAVTPSEIIRRGALASRVAPFNLAQVLQGNKAARERYEEHLKKYPGDIDIPTQEEAVAIAERLSPQIQEKLVQLGKEYTALEQQVRGATEAVVEVSPDIAPGMKPHWRTLAHPDALARLDELGRKIALIAQQQGDVFQIRKEGTRAAIPQIGAGVAAATGLDVAPRQFPPIGIAEPGKAAEYFGPMLTTAAGAALFGPVGAIVGRNIGVAAFQYPPARLRREVTEKVARGEELDEEERGLFELMALRNTMRPGGLFQVASGGAALLPYAVSVAAGLSAAAPALAKVGLTKEAIGGLKGFDRLTGWMKHAGAVGLISAAMNPAEVATEMERYMTGTAQAYYSPETEEVYAILAQKGDSPINALLKAAGVTTVRYGTEQLGNVTDDLVRWTGRKMFGKALGKVTGEAADEALRRGAAASLIQRYGFARAKQVADKFGLHTFPSEMSEEIADLFFSAQVEDQPPPTLDEFAAFLVTSAGVLALPGIAKGALDIGIRRGRPPVELAPVRPPALSPEQQAAAQTLRERIAAAEEPAVGIEPEEAERPAVEPAVEERVVLPEAEVVPTEPPPTPEAPVVTPIQQAIAETISAVGEIEDEFVPGAVMTEKQQRRIDRTIADAAAKYGIDEQELRRNVLWELVRRPAAELPEVAVEERPPVEPAARVFFRGGLAKSDSDLLTTTTGILWFTTDPNEARWFSEHSPMRKEEPRVAGKRKPRVVAVSLTLKNPATWEQFEALSKTVAKEMGESFWYTNWKVEVEVAKRLKAAGYDGIYDPTRTWSAVFSTEQAKPTVKPAPATAPAPVPREAPPAVEEEVAPPVEKQPWEMTRREHERVYPGGRGELYENLSPEEQELAKQAHIKETGDADFEEEPWTGFAYDPKRNYEVVGDDSNVWEDDIRDALAAGKRIPDKLVEQFLAMKDVRGEFNKLPLEGLHPVIAAKYAKPTAPAVEERPPVREVPPAPTELRAGFNPFAPENWELLGRLAEDMRGVSSDREEWTRMMRESLGEGIAPHLDDIWTRLESEEPKEAEVADENELATSVTPAGKVVFKRRLTPTAITGIVLADGGSPDIFADVSTFRVMKLGKMTDQVRQLRESAKESDDDAKKRRLTQRADRLVQKRQGGIDALRKSRAFESLRPKTEPGKRMTAAQTADARRDIERIVDRAYAIAKEEAAKRRWVYDRGDGTTIDRVVLPRVLERAAHEVFPEHFPKPEFYETKESEQTMANKALHEKMLKTRGGGTGRELSSPQKVWDKGNTNFFGMLKRLNKDVYRHFFPAIKRALNAESDLYKSFTEASDEVKKRSGITPRKLVQLLGIDTDIDAKVVDGFAASRIVTVPGQPPKSVPLSRLRLSVSHLAWLSGSLRDPRIADEFERLEKMGLLALVFNDLPHDPDTEDYSGKPIRMSLDTIRKMDALFRKEHPALSNYVQAWIEVTQRVLAPVLRQISNECADDIIVQNVPFFYSMRHKEEVRRVMRVLHTALDPASIGHLQPRTGGTSPFIIDRFNNINKHQAGVVRYISRQPIAKVLAAFMEDPRIAHAIFYRFGKGTLDALTTALQHVYREPIASSDLSGAARGVISRIMPAYIAYRLSTIGVQVASFLAAFPHMTDRAKKAALVRFFKGQLISPRGFVLPRAFMKRLYASNPWFWARWVHKQGDQYLLPFDLTRTIPKTLAEYDRQKNVDRGTWAIRHVDMATISCLGAIVRDGVLTEARKKGEKLTDDEINKRVGDELMELTLVSPQPTWDEFSSTQLALEGRHDFLARMATVYTSAIGKIGVSMRMAIEEYGNSPRMPKDFRKLLAHIGFLALSMLAAEAIREGVNTLIDIVPAMLRGGRAGLLRALGRHWQKRPPDEVMLEWFVSVASSANVVLRAGGLARTLILTGYRSVVKGKPHLYRGSPDMLGRLTENVISITGKLLRANRSTAVGMETGDQEEVSKGIRNGMSAVAKALVFAGTMQGYGTEAAADQLERILVSFLVDGAPEPPPGENMLDVESFPPMPEFPPMPQVPVPPQPER